MTKGEPRSKTWSQLRCDDALNWHGHRGQMLRWTAEGCGHRMRLGISVFEHTACFSVTGATTKRQIGISVQHGANTSPHRRSSMVTSQEGDVELGESSMTSRVTWSRWKPKSSTFVRQFTRSSSEVEDTQDTKTRSLQQHLWEVA